MRHPFFSPGLFTDLYELTMAQAYWQSGQTGSATFELFFRKLPPDRGYLVFAGLADILQYLEAFHFSHDDIEYLRSLRHFDENFLSYLQQLRFRGSVRAMPEASICFPVEPIIEINGPVIECQLVETYVLNQANLQTVLASKAARVTSAAQGKHLVDFASRRTQGLDAADKLARLSYLAGFDSTSNLLAGARHGIPVSGTMAHSFITSFTSEIEAFRHYARSFPDSSTFLVDTYDTIDGTKKAAIVAREMEKQGHRLQAIRLDSGDMLELSRRARAVLDQAGLPYVQIFASGGLDEFKIEELLRAGAPIDGFGVGTNVGVSADAPWTDCAYKLVEYEGRPTLKLSTEKKTLPGSKQAFRFYDAKGNYQGDAIGRADEKLAGAEPLLHHVMVSGEPKNAVPSLPDLRKSFNDQFARLPEAQKKLRAPEPYDVQISESLENLGRQVARQTLQRETGMDM